jgi:uncharacterized protein
MPIPATLITAGALGLVYFILCLRVVMRRFPNRISMGDGGDQALQERIRAHANFAEYVPFLLLLMGGIELAAGHKAPWLWLAGGTLVLARIAHAIGMSRPSPNMFRAFGWLASMALILALSLWALALGLGLQPPAPDYV